MITQRLVRDDDVAALLASDDAELSSLVAANEAASVGVGGGSGVMQVDDVPVFVKRIPLTDVELANPHSTANLFELPLFCQYGLGGPGFNAWRELAANLTMSEMVRSGRTASFPLLHHWRVLPGRAAVAPEHADIDAAVAAQQGDAAVRRRLEALAAASASLVLFCEYIPVSIGDWLADDPPSKAAVFEEQLSAIVAALTDAEVLHFDGHFGNLRADGGRVYLTDFGLATSPRFDLAADEREFVARNAAHDADYAAMRLVNWIVTAVCGVPTPADVPPVARNAYVRRVADGDVPPDVPPQVADILVRHAPTAARMNAFYWKLFDGELHTPYPGTDG